MASPLELLKKMQQDTMGRMPALPEEERHVDLWSGVAFRLGDMRLAAPLDSVTEVLHCPDATPVPGTRSWLKGVANVRGNLITIVDLSEFFGLKPVFISERSRLLVMNVEEFNTALLVDEVYGLRHFDVEGRQGFSAPDDAVGAFITGAFLRDDTLWGVFDMNALADSAAFRNVSAH